MQKNNVYFITKCINKGLHYNVMKVAFFLGFFRKWKFLFILKLLKVAFFTDICSRNISDYFFLN